MATSCALLLALLYSEKLRADDFTSYGFLAVLSLLACLEKLTALMNTIAVERDWVVIIAGDDEDHLRSMFYSKPIPQTLI